GEMRRHVVAPGASGRIQDDGRHRAARLAGLVGLAGGGSAFPVKLSKTTAPRSEITRCIADGRPPFVTNTAMARCPPPSGNVIMPTSLITTAVVPVLWATTVSGGRRFFSLW